MNNYIKNISKNNLTIYDSIPTSSELFIPTSDLEKLLTNHLVGISLQGLALRTRSKVVKEKICEALGYPIPKSFTKTQPRFPGQNLDVYIQKSMNVQIWNEEIDENRRYAFLKVDTSDTIASIKVITGKKLIGFDKTGKLTTKYQATLSSNKSSALLSTDSDTVINWINYSSLTFEDVSPNFLPSPKGLLPIQEIYDRLTPLIGTQIDYIDSIQERNRGANLHKLICEHLGYNLYNDDGTYPDIKHQLLEVKLQTSPTIDLGLHSPEEGLPVLTINETTFTSKDIRYVIFDGAVENGFIILKRLYVVSGHDFNMHFPICKGRNQKIQLPLPQGFFD